MVVAFELLQVTLIKQAPGNTAELMVTVITVSDIMVQSTAGRSQADAEHDCDSETKLEPEMVIVAPG